MEAIGLENEEGIRSTRCGGGPETIWRCCNSGARSLGIETGTPLGHVLFAVVVKLSYIFLPGETLGSPPFRFWCSYRDNIILFMTRAITGLYLSEFLSPIAPILYSV